jgi:hypothetical protein
MSGGVRQSWSYSFFFLGGEEGGRGVRRLKDKNLRTLRAGHDRLGEGRGEYHSSLALVGL